MKKKNYDYSKLWLVFVNIKAIGGFKFNDLIDSEHSKLNFTYQGAWANIILIGNDINTVLEILPKGLAELSFEVVFVDKIENIQSLFDNSELNEDVLLESNWLIESNYVFKISDKLFPYE
ncbi:MAG: hypothetical protein ACRCVT_02465 [Leadbetterella sp.]